MTIDEIKIALSQGKKVTHRFFDTHEYVYQNLLGQIVDETGIVHTEFWEIRKDDHWKDGWDIYLLN